MDFSSAENQSCLVSVALSIFDFASALSWSVWARGYSVIYMSAVMLRGCSGQGAHLSIMRVITVTLQCFTDIVVHSSIKELPSADDFNAENQRKIVDWIISRRIGSNAFLITSLMKMCTQCFHMHLTHKHCTSPSVIIS